MARATVSAKSDPIDFLVAPHQVPDDQRYWVVRADSGLYFPHFRAANCIAIGHLDKLDLAETGDKPYFPDFDRLVDRLRQYQKEDKLNDGQFTSLVNQVYKFIYEMMPGDLVLTPDLGNGRLMVGRIVGLPRISREPIAILNSRTNVEATMELGLRRKVIWGGIVSRSTFPVNLLRSLRANQTVFNIDRHWQALHHILFPAFCYDDATYVSFRINQPNDIDNLSVGRFFSFLSEAEIFADLIGSGSNAGQDEFFARLQTALTQGGLSLTVKAQFMSEGDVNGSFWGTLGKRSAFLYLVASILFGNQHAGFDGVIDLETRHKMWGFVIDRWINNGGQHVANNLRLSAPSENVRALGDASHDEAMPHGMLRGGAYAGEDEDIE